MTELRNSWADFLASWRDFLQNNKEEIKGINLISQIRETISMASEMGFTPFQVFAIPFSLEKYFAGSGQYLSVWDVISSYEVTKKLGISFVEFLGIFDCEIDISGVISQEEFSQRAQERYTHGIYPDEGLVRVTWVMDYLSKDTLWDAINEVADLYFGELPYVNVPPVRDLVGGNEGVNYRTGLLICAIVETGGLTIAEVRTWGFPT